MTFWTRRRAILPICLVSLLLLSGCNQEKAQALVNAANAFKVEGLKAIASYETVFLAAAKTLDLNSETQLAQAQAAVKSFYKKNSAVSPEELLLALGRTNVPSASDVIAGEFAAARQYLTLFADSLARLPDASYLVKDETIACTIEQAARLTDKFAVIGKNLKTDPVPMRARLGQLRGMLNRALKAGDGEQQLIILSQVKEVLEEGDRLNEAALAQTLIAAQSGVTVVEAARNFQKLDLAQILALFGKGLAIVDGSNVFNTTKAIEKLNGIQASLKSDDVWKVILSKPLGAEGTPCRAVKTPA